MEPFLLRHRRFLVFGALAFCASFAMIAAFLLRFDFLLPQAELFHLKLGLLLAIPLKLIVFRWVNIHRGWWATVGVIDALWIAGGSAIASLALVVPILLIAGPSFPRSIYVLDFLLTVITISCVRILLRLYKEAPSNEERALKKRAVLIYGAGWAGAGLLREIMMNPKLGLKVAGFLDDNAHKQKDSVLGTPILGMGRDLATVIARLAQKDVHVAEVLVAIPSATGKQMRAAVALCREANVACRTLPGISDILINKDLSSQIRNLSVEDLLSREAVELDEPAIRASLIGRAVMITGAGGSIGSELSRQIADFQPKILVLVDRAESDLFRIDLQLRRNHPGLTIVAEVADVCEAWRMERLICDHGIECIFHAAAYKHVPLMESHPLEAARNNVLGTWTLAKTAWDHQVRSFVMISSDKAVNPTNIMGATKRAAELVVSSLPSGEGATKFSSVRFGNVLASNGSVIPIFEDQIRAGGPITVTHPEIRRYFMTIREAVQLVLQASVMGEGSETFVLDMGEPVRIVDLARNMVRLAGLVPD